MATSSITAHIVMSNAKGANALVCALAREHNPRFERHDPKLRVLTGEDGLRALRRKTQKLV